MLGGLDGGCAKVTDSGQRPLPMPVIGQWPARLRRKVLVFNFCSFPFLPFSMRLGRERFQLVVTWTNWIKGVDPADPFVDTRLHYRGQIADACRCSLLIDPDDGFCQKCH